MGTEADGKLGYRIGPEPELLAQIGQIIVNYSECERAIFQIFKGVMDLTPEDGQLLVKAGNVNPEKMIAIVQKKMDGIQPALLRKPLRESIALFRSTIEFRNVVAHWQWAISDGETGFATNSIKDLPGAEPVGKSIQLSELKSKAWVLAKAASMLNHVAICMYPVPRIELSGPAWEPGYYSRRGQMDELMLGIALLKTQEMLSRVEASMAPAEPEPSGDKAPQ